MVNYQLGKIYKIVCRITGEVYVGSTCEKTLAKRLAVHRRNCKYFQEGTIKNKNSSFQIILRGEYYIDLLESYPCSNNDELRKREREYFDKIECINIHRPYISVEELKILNLKCLKNYEAKNREFINEKKRHYNLKNKKIPTEEEVEAKRIKKLQEVEKMREIKRVKYEAKLAANPNHIEEMKARHKEQKRIYHLNYRKIRAEKERLEKESKNTI